jgi:carbamoyltransferase
MTVLGISAFYHDSAAAIIQDGKIIAAAQEERFTRVKNDAAFPVNAIRFCLQCAGRAVNELDAVAFYDKPFLKFERLLETYYAFAPKGLSSFITSMPVWIKEKLFLKKIIYESIQQIEPFDRRKIKLLFPEHHLSHAASAFYPSVFEDAAIITLDGVGEWATASVCKGNGNKIRILKQLNFPHSLGLLYSAFTYYCGFKVNSDEYKLMGLAAYGNRESETVKKYIHTIKTKLVDIKEDGSFFLEQQYFDYCAGLKMTNSEKWKELFGMEKREPEDAIAQHHCDLAFAIQFVTEEIIILIARMAKQLTQSRNLCLAGGVALNCVANGKLDDLKLFDQIFIQPAAGDAGGALGAAYAAHHIYYNQERKSTTADTLDFMQGAFLGKEYSDQDIKEMARKYSAPFDYYSDESELLSKTASLISEGKVIGWHQGRTEFGPRSLGARSILADARHPEMQQKLNIKIKFRESFRPFAPAVTAEDAKLYFEIERPSPYMLLAKGVQKNRRYDYPADMNPDDMYEKLRFVKSDLPAITHVDYSARIQTVHKETNYRLWKLLQAYKKQTGYAVMVNTSFNVRDEPIVNSPEDAYKCFMQTGIDFLVISNFVFDKFQQPSLKLK